MAMKNSNGVSAAKWFYGPSGFGSSVGFNGASQEERDLRADKHCEVCDANMGRMSLAAWEVAGRDCGCRPE